MKDGDKKMKMENLIRTGNLDYFCDEEFYRIARGKQAVKRYFSTKGAVVITDMSFICNDIVSSGIKIIIDRFKELDIDYKKLGFEASFELYEMYYGNINKDSFEYQCMHKLFTDEFYG